MYFKYTLYYTLSILMKYTLSKLLKYTESIIQAFLFCDEKYTLSILKSVQNDIYFK